jgi:regulator of sigma E protease
MTILYFIIAIGILIMVHELGHFFIARRSGIRVEKFSIGFGPKLASFKRGETEYIVAPVPLGGYVKMTGEDPAEDGALTDERSFAQKSVWTRIKVVAAGPLMNVILAFIFMPIVFMMGRMEPAYLTEVPVVIGVEKDSPAKAAGLEKGDVITGIDGRHVTTWDEVQKTIIISVGRELDIDFQRNGAQKGARVKVATMPELKAGYIGIEPIFFIGNSTLIDSVAKDGPAGKAGILAKDKVVAIGGSPVETWTEMSKMIHVLDGRPVLITVERGGKRYDFDIQPEYNKEAKRWVIGVVKGLRSADLPMVERKYGLFDAVKSGFNECVNLIGLTFEVLKRLFTGQLSYKSLGGPIQIAQASAAAARYGMAEFLYFMAFLSIQLGILNLLPIPVLDGGHILFCGIEGVSRRRIPPRVREISQYIGLALILTLFLFITVNDIENVWGIKKLLAKLGWK